MAEKDILSPASPENEMSDVSVVGSEHLLLILPNTLGLVSRRMAGRGAGGDRGAAGGQRHAPGGRGDPQVHLPV